VKGLLRAFAVALAGALSVTAAAQTTIVEPGAAQRCLTRGTLLLGSPEYPEEAYRLKQGAKVLVELVFERADVAPRIEQLKVENAGGFDAAFEGTVRRFIEDYRVPCLKTRDSASLRQEFLFVPHDGRPVSMFAAQDERVSNRRELLSCMKHARPGTGPEYPMTDLRAGRQGNVVLRVAFSDAQSAPTVEVLDDGGGGWLADSASNFARDYRLPCHDGAGAVSAVQFYHFQIEGAARVVLKDVPFLTLLSGLKGIREANVYFDFNTMGCPFDVRFDPKQPVLPNGVGEVGSSNPERRFFLDWLTRQQLDLPKQQLNALLGQQSVVTVPCTVINLGARQGGGGSK
jgi:hypothetical protein